MIFVDTNHIRKLITDKDFFSAQMKYMMTHAGSKKYFPVLTPKMMAGWGEICEDLKKTKDPIIDPEFEAEIIEMAAKAYACTETHDSSES